MSKALDDLNESADELGDPTPWSDWHSVVTIQFGELINSNDENGDPWDWGRDDYPAIDTDTRDFINERIEDRFFYREICVVPPGKFKLFLTRKLKEVMPKYNRVLQFIKDDRLDITEQSQSYTENRNVFSDYPQSQIKGTADYASNATDVENKSRSTGAPLDAILQYNDRYDEVIVSILNDLEVCFSSLSTVNVNS